MGCRALGRKTPGGVAVVLLIAVKPNCEVLRALKMLSIASDASCRAIMSSCEVWPAPMVMPSAASVASSPTARITMEIMTSRSEKPD